MTGRYIAILVGMTAATFISRYPVLFLAGRRTLPVRLRELLDYIPPAVLISITVPAVLVQDNSLAISPTNEYLIASVVTIVVARRSRHLFIAIIAGMFALWGWRLLLPYL